MVRDEAIARIEAAIDKATATGFINTANSLRGLLVPFQSEGGAASRVTESREPSTLPFDLFRRR